MGRYSGIENEKVTQRNPYIPVGRHKLEIVSVRSETSFKKFDYTIAELKVLETDSDKIKTGDLVSFFVKHEPGTSWLGNVKAFFCAAYGASNLDPADAEAATSSANPLAGGIVRVYGALSKPEDPTSFVRLSWSLDSLPPSLMEKAS